MLGIKEKWKSQTYIVYRCMCSGTNTLFSDVFFWETEMAAQIMNVSFHGIGTAVFRSAWNILTT